MGRGVHGPRSIQNHSVESGQPVNNIMNGWEWWNTEKPKTENIQESERENRKQTKSVGFLTRCSFFPIVLSVLSF